MAINVYGTGPTIGAAQWSQLMQDLGDAGGGMAVPAGMAVTPGSGRSVSVSAGRTLQAGTTVVMDSAGSVTLAANAASSPRIDVVCVEVDWTAGGGSASLVVVQGTAAANPSVPKVTQNPGSKWQTPLAQVTVAAGASSIPSGNITDVRSGKTSGSSTARVTCAIPGNWTQASPALTVARAGNIVEVSGVITRSSGADYTVGTTAALQNVIPAGFLPSYPQITLAVANTASAPKLHHVSFGVDGTMSIRATAGPITVGDNLFVSHLWIGA